MAYLVDKVEVEFSAQLDKVWPKKGGRGEQKYVEQRGEWDKA